MNVLLKILLSPFALVFWLISKIRNKCYDYGIIKSTEFDVPIISVGNLAVGGSGKTPMVEFLIRELQSSYKITVLSRGYGRKSVGFKWVESSDHYLESGDEPLQVKLKFPHVSVAVCAKRVDGVIQILTDKPDTNLIILDDGFQHRAIKPKLQLVLSAYHNPFFKDFIMPIGQLRESKSGLNRADALIITKTPETALNLSIPTKYSLPLFYTGIKHEIVFINNTEFEIEKSNIFGFSALANNNQFIELLKKSYNLKGFLGYRDHYSYAQKDINEIEKNANGAALICTEKDWIKVKDLDIKSNIAYISIEVNPLNKELIPWIKKQLK